MYSIGFLRIFQLSPTDQNHACLDSELPHRDLIDPSGRFPLGMCENGILTCLSRASKIVFMPPNAMDLSVCAHVLMAEMK